MNSKERVHSISYPRKAEKVDVKGNLINNNI